MKKQNENEQLNNETETKAKPKKKMSKKKLAIIYCAIGVPVIALGVVGGVLLGKKFFYKDPYSGVDIDELNDDYSEVYAKYQTTSSDKYFSEFNNVELANIALLNLNHVDNFYALTEGSVVAAGVKQTINATYLKNGDNYFEETITSSQFVKAANRFYQIGETTSWYKGKYVNEHEGNYSSLKPTEYTNDQFEEEWGRKMSRACIYIINKSTTLNSTITDNSDGTYQIDLDLDPKLSVVRYIKQMVNTGGLTQKPVFHAVKLSFVIDKDVKLLTFKTDERYDVHMIIDAKNSKGAITQDYVYAERKIPSVDENCNYEK